MGNCLEATTDSEDTDILHSSTDVAAADQPPSLHRDSDDPLSQQTVEENRLERLRRANYELNYAQGSSSDQQHSNAASTTSDESARIARRIGFIQHLPVDLFVPGKNAERECVICMADFCDGDKIRFLPCMHTYHVQCIDDWLMRSFTCPSCMEPVDSALLSSYDQGYSP